MWACTRLLKTSRILISLMSELSTDLQIQQNVYTLDVRIHHRICDAQRRLLQTLVKRLEKLIKFDVTDLGMYEIVENVSNINCIKVRIQ